ncbi:MAG: hypothetical protein ACC649_02970, partial [Myxococcota bacterium]
MPKITIDGREIEAADGRTILQALPSRWSTWRKAPDSELALPPSLGLRLIVHAPRTQVSGFRID